MSSLLDNPSSGLQVATLPAPSTSAIPVGQGIEESDLALDSFFFCRKLPKKSKENLREENPYLSRSLHQWRLLERNFMAVLSPLRPAGGDPGLDHLQKKFLTVCVSLSGLGPSESHEKVSMRQMCDSSNENKAKSCSFLDAIRRCLCSRSAVWLKIDGREIPVSTVETGRYATVRFN